MSFFETMAVVQAVILFLGLGGTAYSLHRQHIENKRISTLNLIIHQRSDDKLNEAIDIVGKLARQKKDFSDLSENFKDLESENSRAILRVLNFREFVSVGINQGIIDEKAYKQAYYSVMLRDWKYLRNTIYAIRDCQTGSKTSFQDFEKLITRWEKKPLKKCVK